MTFTEAIRTCLTRKYATVEGRANRSEFWWFALFQFLVMVVASRISDVLSGITALALLLPGVGVGGRRLHDIGKSAWLLLIGFIPLVGHLILLYWFVQPSNGANEFGVPEVTPYSPTVMPGSGPQ
jgi:uncharacterized membrane protein YhaH (DUF805 family)